MGWRGFLTGALALVFLETIVQPDASKRVSGGIGWMVGAVRKFLDPAVPAIGAPAKSKNDRGSGGLFGDLLDLLPSGPLSGIPGSLVAAKTPAATSTPNATSSAPYSLIPKPSTGGSALVLA